MVIEAGTMKWITVKKFSMLSGYTIKAVYNKIERGVWNKDEIWRKAPDGRLFINIIAFENWVQGVAA